MPPSIDNLQPPAVAYSGTNLLDPATPAGRALLEDLPGQILQGHGRVFSQLHFLRFTAPDGGRAWLRQTGAHVTTAFAQWEQGAAWRTAARTDGGLFVGLYLTQDGLAGIGEQGILTKEDPSFRAGARARAPALKQDPAAEWQREYREIIHALLVLAYDSTSEAAAVAFVRGHLTGQAGVVVVKTEAGAQFFDGPPPGENYVEHFGHVDGITPMRFLAPRLPVPPAPPLSPLTPQQRQLELFPLRHVLVPLQPAADGTRRYGSLLVYQKLEQNVPAFRAAVTAYTAAAPGFNPDLARARIVGRFRDGTPLALQAAPGLGAAQLNAFDYTEPTAAACPYHAHIHKMAPRGRASAPVPEAPLPQQRLPVRRSVTYGARALRAGTAPEHRILDVDSDPAEEVGLLFLVFVAGIEKQFEHVVQFWANTRGFPAPSTPADPLIGRVAGGVGVEDVPNPHPPPPTEIFVFSSCVIARGGCYLLAPPPSFFRSL